MHLSSPTHCSSDLIPGSHQGCNGRPSERESGARSARKGADRLLLRPRRPLRGLFCACLPGCPPMLSSARTPPCLLTLILVSALSVVSLTMFLPSLASIATAFGAAYGLVNLSIAGYSAMTAGLPRSDESRYGTEGVSTCKSPGAP